MEITQNNYLSLYDILTQEVFGSVTLFIAIGVILISFFCAKYAIPFQVSMLLMFLFVAVIAIITQNISYWILVVLAVGVIVYWILSKILRRG